MNGEVKGVIKGMLLLASLVAVLSVASASELSVTVTFDEPKITTVKLGNDSYDFISIDNCGFNSKIGEPALPVKTVFVLLPSDKEVKNVTAHIISQSNLPGSYRIYPVQPPANTYIDEIETVKPNPEVYSSDKPYISNVAEYVGTEVLRGYKIAMIKVYPVQYIPAKSSVTFYEAIQLKLELSSSEPPVVKRFPAAEKWIKSHVVNPNMKESYQTEPATLDYLIITRDMFLPQAEEVRLYKEGQCYSVAIETVENITTVYDGRDSAEQIRNCIVDYYLSLGIQWVLLMGDVDPDTPYDIDKPWEVPTRYVYNPDDYYGDGDYTPTDYYYAGLDGNWDADGDGVYGESEYYSITDEADWFADIYVGRITAQTTDEMWDQVNKLTSFVGGVDSMLLLGAVSDEYGPTDEKELKEYIRDNFIPPEVNVVELYESDGTLNEANVIDAINTHQPKVVNSASHGSETGLWLYYDGTYFDIYTPGSLTNSPYLWYAMACLAGAFDYTSDCVGEAMMKDSDGSAVAWVGGTRVTWYWVGFPEHLEGLNGMQDWLYWATFFAGDDQPGSCLYNSKAAYVGYGFDLQQEYERKNLFAYQLLGDPSLHIGKVELPPVEWTKFIDDPTGDTYNVPLPDITEVDFNSTAEDLKFRVVTSEPIDYEGEGFGSIIAIDTDQSNETGCKAYWWYIVTNDIGADYAAVFFTPPEMEKESKFLSELLKHADISKEEIVKKAMSGYGTLLKWNEEFKVFECIGDFRVYEGFDNVSYFIPLTMLEDDGTADVVVTVGTWEFPTDHAPNEGHGATYGKAPDIWVEPTSIDIELPENTTYTTTLTIGNDGNGTLEFGIEDVYIAKKAIKEKKRVDTDIDSATPPEGYVAASVKTKLAGGKVLLIKDVDPWGYSSNEEVLMNLGISYDVANSRDVADIDLSKYKVVIIASDQPQSFYDTMATLMPKFEDYVSKGGILEVHACDMGWQGGYWSELLPGHVHHETYYDQYNYIVDPEHPIVEGLTDEDFQNWNHVSHGYFTDLVEGTHIILVDSEERPTFIEYKFGAGVVVASMETLEWTVQRGYCQDGKILYNTISYTYGLGVFEWLMEEPEEGIIPPGGTMDITVTINTTGMKAGEIHYALKIISSNDPDEPEVVIPVNLTITPPDIWVEPTKIDVVLPPNTTYTTTLTIGNDGNGTLEFGIEDVFITGKDRNYPNTPDTNNVSKSKTLANVNETATRPKIVKPPEVYYKALGPIKVLLVSSDYAESTDFVRDYLLAFDDIETVDIFDASSGVPTLDLLLDYDAVMVWSNYYFYDPVALGDVIADYIDAGGGVVATSGCWAGYDWELKGRFKTGGYSPFVSTGDYLWYSWADLGWYNSEHPIMMGVTSISGYYRGIVDTAEGAELIAEWEDGEQFVAVKSNVVGIALLPGYYGSNDWTGDFPTLVHNSLVWVAEKGRKPWLKEEPEEGIIEPGGTMDITVTINTTGMKAGEIHYALKIISSNDPDEPEVVIPVNLTVAGEFPNIWVDPTEFYITSMKGEVTERTLTIGNDGNATLTYDISVDAYWLSVSPASGSVEPGSYDDVTVTADATTLDPGIYEGNITIWNNDPDENPTVVPVLLEVIEFNITRELPEYVLSGSTVNVIITFTPNENLTAVGLADTAPWVPEVNKDWCTPPADQENVEGTTAQYIWYEIANGTEVTAIYKVTVPEDAAGTYTFSGYLSYRDEAGVKHNVSIGGDSALIVVPFNITRELPEYATNGSTFDVKITFKPNENLTAIGLHDEAPWIPTVNKDWCTPPADQENVEGTTAQYIWYEIANGTEVTAIYKVTVPEDAEEGFYIFDGYLSYRDPEGVKHEVPVLGDSIIEVIPRIPVSGTVYEVNDYAGTIAGATVELIKDGTVVDSTTTDENGNYTLIAPEPATYTVKASKEGYAEREQVITIEEFEPVTLNFRYDDGLIPLDPSFDYVLDCIYLWKTGKLNFDTILDVIFYWKT